MGVIRRFLCKSFGWHKPNGNAWFDGVNRHSKCKYCGKDIIQDSQGNWFSIGE